MDFGTNVNLIIRAFVVLFWSIWFSCCYSVSKLFPVCAASAGEEISLVLAARYLSAGKVLWDCPMGIPLFQGISGWKRKVLCLQGYRCFSHWALDVAGFFIPLAQPSDSCRKKESRFHWSKKTSWRKATYCGYIHFPISSCPFPFAGQRRWMWVQQVQ